MVISSLGQTTYPSGISGCVARWTFDTTEVNTLTIVPDLSVNGNNGYPYNVASVPGFRYKPFSAGGFDGISSWVEVLHNTNQVSNEISIISLVKVNDFNSNTCQGSQILSKGYPYFISGNYGQVLNDNPYDGDCNIYSPNFTQLCTQTGLNTPYLPAGNYLDLNKWYFLASVIKNDSILQYTLFMDSSLKSPTILPISSLSGSFSTGGNTQDISIGKHLNPSYQYYFNGSIDELVLFNRALSNNEVYNIYSYLWGNPNAISEVPLMSEFDINFDNNRVAITSEKGVYSIGFYDMLGNLILRKEELLGKTLIDISDFSNGMYIVKVFNKQGSFTKKIIKGKW